MSILVWMRLKLPDLEIPILAYRVAKYQFISLHWIHSYLTEWYLRVNHDFA